MGENVSKCKCGCGQEAKVGRRFIWGHNSRSLEHKKRLQERNKKYNASPKGRAQFKKLHKEWNSSPEGKAHAKKMSENWHDSPEGKAHLESWNNSPKNIANIKKAGAEWRNSPEGKAQLEKMTSSPKRIPQLRKWQRSPEGKAHFEKWNSSPENISQLLNAPCPYITFGECGIIGHKHRSKLESKYCTKLQVIYPPKQIHSCVRIGRKETDFVISQSEDIKTWLKVIEIHASYWDVLNDVDDYVQTRTEELRAAGVTCPIEIIVQRQSRQTINKPEAAAS